MQAMQYKLVTKRYNRPSNSKEIDFAIALNQNMCLINVTVPLLLIGRVISVVTVIIADHILVAETVVTDLISVSTSTHVSACQLSSDTAATLA